MGRSVPRRLRFTREGKLLFFVTLGIGFGAVNSGNNLLYLVLGVLLSLIMISGVLSENTLRGLTAVRHGAPVLTVGAAALVRIDLHNLKRRFASLSIEVSELLAPDSGAEQRRGFVLSCRPGEQVTTHLRLACERRGEVLSAGLRLTTRFPFGFFEKSRIIPVPGRYLVLPSSGLVGMPGLAPVVAGVDEQLARVGHGDEFYGLRDARPGDDARTIAWKVTARRDKLIVREFQRPAARRVVLVVANVVPRGVEEARSQVERAIAVAASLDGMLIDAGYAVGLATADGGLAPDGGRDALLRLQAHLATLPLRSVVPGSRPPLFEGYSLRHAERLAVVTPAQRAAGIVVEAERSIELPDEASPEEVA